MRSWKSGLAGMLCLIAVLFFVFVFYGNSEVDAWDVAKEQSRARWAWVLTSRDYLESKSDKEVVSDDCDDCDGSGTLGDGTVEVDCDTCNGTGKGGFQMTILKMPVQPVQVDCPNDSRVVQGKPIRAVAKRGRMFLGRVVRKIRCRK